MERIILTGASGFLGKNLIERISKEKIIILPHEEIKVTTIKPFSRFFFLSAYGNMAHHDDDDKIIQANLLDLVDMATQAKRFEFDSFVFISTSSVKLKYQTLYSRTKKAAEEVLLALAEKHNLPFCIIRPYSITGVGEQKEHLIPTLIRAAMTGEIIDFVAKPVHDFIDVSDVVEAIINLSDHGVRGIYEVGTGMACSNQQVREIVERITGKPISVRLVSKMRDYDNEEWVYKNYRARSFGWLPKKSLEDSIRGMVEAYKYEK